MSEENATGSAQETTTSLPRMGIYIDLHNVEKAMEDYNLHGIRLNYSTLVDEVSEGYEVVCVKAYDSTESEDRQLKGLHDCLESKSFGMVLKKPQVLEEKNGQKRLVQKEVDTSIVADVIDDAVDGVFDVCMIISGDRDMCPAVEKVKKRGKKALVAGFAVPMASCLKEKADGCTIIEDTMAFEAVPESGTLLSNYASRTVTVEGGETVAY